MATPALRALRNHHGRDAQIVGVMRPYVSQVLSGTDWLDDVVHFDRRSDDIRRRCIRVAKALRDRRIDTALLLTNSLGSAAVAWMSGAIHRIGYAANARGVLLTKKLYFEREGLRRTPISAVDAYLNVVRATGVDVNSASLELGTTPHAEQVAKQIWDELRLATVQHTVLLNTGSASSPARHWPTESYIELAKRLAERPDVSVLVVCGPSEQSTARDIVKHVNHPRVHSMANQDLSLEVSKAVIRRASVFVSTDSGPRHLAAAFQVPTVTLSGPIDPRWTVNYNTRETVLQHQVPCGPCGQQECPLGHAACMRDLSVDRVFHAIERRLNEDTLRRSA